MIVPINKKWIQYYNNCVRTIIDVYESNRSDVWKTIENLSRHRDNSIGPPDDDFVKYLKDASDIKPDNSFNTAYELVALNFLQRGNVVGICLWNTAS